MIEQVHVRKLLPAKIPLPDIRTSLFLQIVLARDVSHERLEAFLEKTHSAPIRLGIVLGKNIGQRPPVRNWPEGSTPESVLSSETIQNADAAAVLYRSGVINRILTSSKATHKGYASEAASMRHYLNKVHNVPASVMDVDEISEDTERNGIEVVRMLHQEHYEAVLDAMLISTREHVPRAGFLFHHAVKNYQGSVRKSLQFFICSSNYVLWRHRTQSSDHGCEESCDGFLGDFPQLRQYALPLLRQQVFRVAKETSLYVLQTTGVGRRLVTAGTSGRG